MQSKSKTTNINVIHVRMYRLLILFDITTPSVPTYSSSAAVASGVNLK